MDLISRQAAIDAVDQYISQFDAIDANFLDGLKTAINIAKELPSAQPESTADAEFWRKRADYYSEMCSELISEMVKGVKIGSVRIDENGIAFLKEMPEPYTKRREE